MNIIKGVVHALSYLHHDYSPPIVHKDISSKNVLLDSEYEAHVSDFRVLAIEVIQGRHPGETISTLSASSV